MILNQISEEKKKLNTKEKDTYVGKSKRIVAVYWKKMICIFKRKLVYVTTMACKLEEEKIDLNDVMSGQMSKSQFSIIFDELRRHAVILR